MRYALALVIIVVVFGVAIWLLIQAIRGMLRRHHLDTAKWELDERSDGELLSLYVHRDGDQDLLVGAVPFGAQDFSDRLIDLRVNGEEKVEWLNRKSRT